MSLDWSLLYWIQNHTVCDLFDLLMPQLTLLGSGGAIWLLAAGGMLCTKKYRRQGVILLVGLAAAVLVGNVCLKNLIARPRPCWRDDSVFMLISVPTDYSFPSGHTLASAIGATVLTKTDRRFGWAAIPIAVIIAFSRLYLFVHFPSDILAGAVLGVIIGEAAYRLGMRRSPARSMTNTPPPGDSLPHKKAPRSAPSRSLDAAPGRVLPVIPPRCASPPPADGWR